MAQTQDQDMRSKIADSFRNYVQLAAFLDEENKQRDVDMMDEYKYWSKVKAKLTKDKTGKYVVSGINLDNKQ